MPSMPLDALAPDQRAVVQLVLQRGRSYAQIAELLKISEDAVRARAHAGLIALAPERRAARRQGRPDRRLPARPAERQAAPGHAPAAARQRRRVPVGGDRAREPRGPRPVPELPEAGEGRAGGGRRPPPKAIPWRPPRTRSRQARPAPAPRAAADAAGGATEPDGAVGRVLVAARRRAADRRRRARGRGGRAVPVRVRRRRRQGRPSPSRPRPPPPRPPARPRRRSARSTLKGTGAAPRPTA